MISLSIPDPLVIRDLFNVSWPNYASTSSLRSPLVRVMACHLCHIQRQSITWASDDLLSSKPLGKKFSEMWISLNNIKIHLIMSSAKYQSFCSGLNVSPFDPRLKLVEAGWRICAPVQHTNIGSDDGLSPGRHQAIICTNDGILLIRSLGTNFSEILR